ncbi:MAG: hypothetical protein JKY00_09745 [Roseicyclus sp.]|nr:hypothetical protein [Roseicyclus sp.]
MANPSSRFLTSLPMFPERCAKTGPRTVVCFGTARGGTSMVAGAILGLGVPMGDRLGRNIEDPVFNLDWHGGPVDRFVSDVRAKIATRNAAHSIWGWKFPFAQRYLDHLIDDLRAPHLVCVYRDPVPMALRSKLGPNSAAKFIAGRLRAQVRNAAMVERLGAPCLMVSYEKASAQPVVFLRELAGFLGIRVPDHRDEIVDFMTPGNYKDPDGLLAHLSQPA